MTKIEDFDRGKYSNDKINNATISDDEVVASYGPPQSLFCHLLSFSVIFVFSHNLRRSYEDLFVSVICPFLKAKK